MKAQGHDPADRAAPADHAAPAELFALLLDSMLEPFVLLQAVRTPDGAVVDFEFIDANAAALAVYQMGRQQLLGQRLSALHPAAMTTELFGMYVAVVDEGKPIVLDDWVYPQDIFEGRPMRYDVRAVKVGDCVSQTWRDVTDRYEAARALADSEASLRLITEHSTDVIMRVDNAGICEWASPSTTATLGWQVDEIVGTRVGDLVHPDHRDPAESARKVLMAGSSAVITAPFRCKDGTYLWLEGAMSPLRDPSTGAVVGRVGTLRDVDARTRATQRLEQSEAKFRAAMESAPAGMALVGLDRSCQQVNGSLCRILGRSEEALTGRFVSDFLDPPDDEIDQQMRRELLAGPATSVTREHEMIRSDGTRLWVEHSIALLRDRQGEPESYVSQFIDVTDSRLARERLTFLATHDTLTELLNRRELVGRLEALLIESAPDVRIAAMFIDVDGLKQINDSLGHSVGDQVIAAVASRLRENVRPHDLVGRFGGDEFVVVLVGLSSLRDALATAARVQEDVCEPVRLGRGRRTVPVSVSIGLAMAERADDPELLLSRADQALYRAKETGRACTVLYDPDDPSWRRPRRR